MSFNIMAELNIRKTKIMASSPIISWQIDGETIETMADFIFWALKSLQMETTMILEPKKIKFLTVSIVFPSICHKVMGPDAMILVF